MTIRYTEEARLDLLDAIEYLEKEAAAAAARIADRVFTTIERLAAGEFEGPENRLSTGERVRSWPIPPYRVYYLREADGVVVLRIYHQARRPLTR